MEETKSFTKADWLKHFVVIFNGEQGMFYDIFINIYIMCLLGTDAGGLSREFFELLTEQCFSSQSGMFRAVDDSPQALVRTNYCITIPYCMR